MNVSLPTGRARPLPFTPRTYEIGRDAGRVRQLRELLSLFAVYATALLAVLVLSDGGDIGCILAGIGGHVLYASVKTARSWREASWLEAARARVLLRARRA
jgi:hypothetical protein